MDMDIVVSSGAHLHCRQRARLGNRRRKHCLSAPPPAWGPGPWADPEANPPSGSLVASVLCTIRGSDSYGVSLDKESHGRQIACTARNQEFVCCCHSFPTRRRREMRVDHPSSTRLQLQILSHPPPSPPSLSYKEFPPGIIPSSAESRVPDCPQFVLPSSLPKAYYLLQDLPQGFRQTQVRSPLASSTNPPGAGNPARLKHRCIPSLNDTLLRSLGHLIIRHASGCTPPCAAARRDVCMYLYVATLLGEKKKRVSSWEAPLSRLGPCWTSSSLSLGIRAAPVFFLAFWGTFKGPEGPSLERSDGQRPGLPRGRRRRFRAGKGGAGVAGGRPSLLGLAC